jgi:hypothetical protein
MNRAPNHPFRGLRPPKAPDHLRRRTIAAARTAPDASTNPPGRPLTDLLWESRPLRIGWALLLLLLLGTNVFLDARSSSAPWGSAETASGRTTLLEAHFNGMGAMLDEAPGLAPERAVRRSS